MPSRVERILVFGSLSLGVVSSANVFYSASVAAAVVEPGRIARAHRITEISIAVTASCALVLVWRLITYVRGDRG